MSLAGFQNFWITGSRFYFEEDPIAPATAKLRDLGVIRASSPINPTLDTERVELLDADGGLQTTCDEKVVRNNEEYEVSLSNISCRNLRLLFLGASCEDFTQVAATDELATVITKGELHKLKDANGTALYSLQIEGVVDSFDLSGQFTSDPITAMVAATKRITTSVDLTTHIIVGEFIIVRTTGLANVANARTYTVAAIDATGINTVEDIAADETAVTGAMIYIATGDTGVIYEQGDTNNVKDWSPSSHDRGILAVAAGSTIVAGSNDVLVTLLALSGERLIRPQTIAGSIVKGTGYIVWARENFTEQNVREARMTITPNASNFSAEDFSDIVINAKVLTDVTEAVTPAGRLLQFKGAIPDPI